VSSKASRGYEDHAAGRPGPAEEHGRGEANPHVVINAFAGVARKP